MKDRRSLGEALALLVLAPLCALLSNALAGPARRLAWWPREAVAPVLLPPPRPAPLPAATPTKPESPAPPRKVKPPPAPGGSESGNPLLERFPPLREAVEAELASEEARWLQLHGALILDARRSADFARGHLPGARSLPVWEDGLEDRVARLEAFTANLKLPVVVYCSGGDCEDSHLLARRLWMAGFRNLRIYTGGFPDWEARGWPVLRGEQP